MKLSKIYSNQKKFKTVTFNDHFNVVLALIKDPANFDKGIHNIGKTLLSELIDFMLLKKLEQNHFLYKKRELFLKYDFFLEIKLKDSDFLTIKRSVEKPTKISFKQHSSPDQNFVKLIDWDEEDMAIGKAEDYLNDKLNFNILPEWNYRRLVSYFIRKQNDYSDVFQLEKYKLGKHIEWKPMLFELLGFNPENTYEKYKVADSIEAQKTLIGELETKLSVDVEEIDKIKGALEIKEAQIKDLKEELSKFNFYEIEQEINIDLVNSIENQINNLNNSLYKANYEIDEISKSLQTKIQFDLDKVTKLFEEVKIAFPEQLKKDYKSLVDFNTKLTTERQKILKEQLQTLISERDSIKNALKILNDQRENALGTLRNKDSFGKYDAYHTRLLALNTEYVRLQDQLQNMDKVESLKKELTKLENTEKELGDKIKEQIINGNEIYKSIRHSFNKIIMDVLGVPALISIKPNSENNLEFQADIQNKEQTEITQESEGFSYKKLLCAVFDLSVLIAYHNKRFFHFAYHDGVLGDLENRRKIRFLNTVREICNQYDLQYIISMTEEDQPTLQGEKASEITPSEVALELSDEGDAGKLFLQTF